MLHTTTETYIYYYKGKEQNNDSNFYNIVSYSPFKTIY